MMHIHFVRILTIKSYLTNPTCRFSNSIVTYVVCKSLCIFDTDSFGRVIDDTRVFCTNYILVLVRYFIWVGFMFYADAFFYF